MRRFGAAGYAAILLVGLGLVLVVRARSEHFIHGEELGWALAYLVPLCVGLVALALGTHHLLRGRIRSLAAWVPVIGSMAFVLWLVAYLFFDAFRSA